MRRMVDDAMQEVLNSEEGNTLLTNLYENINTDTRREGEASEHPEGAAAATNTRGAATSQNTPIAQTTQIRSFIQGLSESLQRLASDLRNESDVRFSVPPAAQERRLLNDENTALELETEAKPASKEEKKIVKELAELLNAMGVETSTDWKKGQRVLDDYKELVDFMSRRNKKTTPETAREIALQGVQGRQKPFQQQRLFEKSALANTSDTDETSDRGRRNDTATLQNTVLRFIVL